MVVLNCKLVLGDVVCHGVALMFADVVILKVIVDELHKREYTV